MAALTGIQGSRPPDQNQTGLEFPKTKCILWDKTATGQPTFLHLGYYRKPKVYIPEKILKLVQHQCEVYGLKSHTLIGSMVVEDDGEGVQFQVDRLDTRPLVSSDLSANLAPGDLLIPLEVTNNDATDRSGTVEDFLAALERLEVQCRSKNSVDVSNFVLLRAWGSFYSNATTSVAHMDFDLVTMATVLKLLPINPVPIALTALSKNLAGPMSLSTTQGTPKSGYLTMDHTRKLLLVLESDPKSATLPIVGIWVSGADFVQHPFVWAACLRYIHSNHLQDRICLPPQEFLLVMYSNLHSRPEFFQCCTANGETKLDFELRSGHEAGNLTKALSNPSQDLLEVELDLPEYGEKKSRFDAAIDKFTSLANSHPESQWDEVSGVSEDIQPRSAPTPHAEKIPFFKPMVPDVSILWPDVPQIPNTSMPATVSHQPLQLPPQPSPVDSRGGASALGYSQEASAKQRTHPQHPFQSVIANQSAMSSHLPSLAHPRVQTSHRLPFSQHSATSQAQHLLMSHQTPSSVSPIPRQSGLNSSASHQPLTSASPLPRQSGPYSSASHQPLTSASPLPRQSGPYSSASHQPLTSASPMTRQNGSYSSMGNFHFTPAPGSHLLTSHSVPFSTNSGVGFVEPSSNMHQQQNMPFYQSYPVATHHSKQFFSVSTSNSTQGSTLLQAAQLPAKGISVNACPNNNNVGPLQTRDSLPASHSGQTGFNGLPLGKNGLPSTPFPNPSAILHRDASVHSSKGQIIRKDIVPASQFPQETGHGFAGSENSSCFPGEGSRPYAPPIVLHATPTNHRPMIQPHACQSPQQSQSAGQLVSATSSNQQNQSHILNQTSNILRQSQSPVTSQIPDSRQFQAPAALLNTVVEETLPCASSSSEESCQCHSVPSLRLSVREENTSSAQHGFNNSTQNSTRSSDDDSGLSVTPERPASSTHPAGAASSGLAGPFQEAAVSQGAAATSWSSSSNPAIDSVNWDNVPPEIRALIVSQNEQLRQLQQQIQFLLRRESQPASSTNDNHAGQFQNVDGPPPHQQGGRRSVTVSPSTLAKDQSNECQSLSVQTSPVKSRQMVDAPLLPPRDNDSFGKSLEGQTDQCLTDGHNGEPVSQSQQRVLESSDNHNQGFNLTTESEDADQDSSVHNHSDPRLELDQASADRNFFMDGQEQNDSFSTMAEDACDPRQYYDQLMNNIQMFLLNGDSEEGDQPLEEDEAPEGTNDTATHLAEDVASDSMTPGINYVSMMLGLGSDAGRSMEINAMALKYLKDDQLTHIARLRHRAGRGDAQSEARILQRVIGDARVSSCETPRAGISPNDMTMATRRYLEKHGLLGENSCDLNDLSTLDHTMKLKTDFSIAYCNQTPSNFNNYRQGYAQNQTPRSAANTPVRKEIVSRNDQQASNLPLRTSPESKQTSLGLDRVIGTDIGKDLGASPVLLTPKRYGRKETFTNKRSSKPPADRRSSDGKGVRGMRKSTNVEADMSRNSEDQEDENILDIAKLKQLPKLL